MKLSLDILRKGWLLAVPLLFHVLAQGQSIRYSNFYDSNSGAEILDEAVVLDDGSLVVAGKTSNSNGTGFGRTFNFVLDEEGTLQHSHVWQEDQVSIGPYAIVRTQSGGIYEAGTRHDYSVPSLGTGDFFLAKLDETGDTLFTKVFERPDTSDFMLDIVQTRPNKLLLMGWTYNDTVDVSSAAQLLFITTDTLGNKLNEVVWGLNGADYIHSGLTINENGEVLITGWIGSNTWLVKTDSIGNVLWHEIHAQFGGDGGTCIVQTLDGNFAILGGSENPTTGNSDGLIIKVNSNGDEIWTRKYPAVNGSQSLWWGDVLEDGSIVACGQTTDTDDGSQAGWLIKTNENGDTLWTHVYNPSPYIDRLLNLEVMQNGDIVMFGSGRREGEVVQDGWVLRVDSMGCLLEGCLSVGIAELENHQRYFKAYPNPATNEFNVEPNEIGFKEVEVVIHDAMGKEVLRFSSNRDRQTIDVSTWARGIYHCTVTNSCCKPRSLS